MSNFKTYSNYYDLLYKDKNYKLESEYVVRKIQSFFPAAKSILELGSGSGSHAKFLCENGFEVTGIERSEAMVSESLNKNIQGFNPIVGNIETTILSKRFDVVISLFHVVSYLTSNDLLMQCFNNTYTHLNANGIFIFDVWYSPAVYFQKPETRIKRLENSDIEVVRIAESEMITSQNVVNVNFEVLIKNKKNLQIQTLNEIHPMRHFSIPEIELLAKVSGFELLMTEEFLSGKAPSESTWGVCFIVRKV